MRALYALLSLTAGAPLQAGGQSGDLSTTPQASFIQ